MKRIFSILLIGTAVSASASYRGDFNSDNRVNLADMAVLATAINSGNPSSTFDLNADGRVDDTDLHVLADIIIKHLLTEDSGVNIGIGGWDDSGEDFGGTVGGKAFAMAPASGPVEFSCSEVAYDSSSGILSHELRLESSAANVCGYVLDISLPSELGMSLDNNFDLLPDAALAADHACYGKISVGEEDGRYRVRALIFSPTLSPLKSTAGIAGHIRYSEMHHDVYRIGFKDCQALCGTSAYDLPERSDYCRFDYSSSAYDISNEAPETEIFTIDGRPAHDCSRPGIYILRQSGGRTQKISVSR